MPKKQNTIHFAHDKLFCGAMSDLRVAQDFLTQHLPVDIQERMDWSTLQLCSGTFVDEHLQKQETDVLLQVQMQTGLGSQSTALIYLLAEHQSKPEKFLPLRKFGYVVDILKRYCKQHKDMPLPLVIPIVLYNGKVPYPYSTEFFPLFGDFADEMRKSISQLYLVDLHKISDERLRERHWSGIMQLVLKHAYHRDFMSIVQVFADLLKTLFSTEAYNYSELIINYTLSQYRIEGSGEFQTILHQYLPPEQEEKLMTIAQMFRQEGMQQGIQVGEAELLLRLLHHKFTRVSDAIEARVRSANNEQLFSWGKAVLFATTIDEIFA